MLNRELINELAELCGIPQEYVGADQKPVILTDECRLAPLKSLGFKVGSDKELKKSIEARKVAIWNEVIPPVVVKHQNSEWALDVCLAKKKLPKKLKLVIELESGEKLEISRSTKDLEVLEKTSISGTEIVKLAFELPEFIPLGYHQATLAGTLTGKSCSLIIVPETCYEPQELLNGEKIWGSGIQLYSVRSEQNWGMGDYRDLNNLVDKLAESGAHYVGLNPVHALYQDNPQHCSPYSPSSRTYSNVMYINPEQVPEFTECKDAQALVASESFQARLKEAQAQNYVDYEATASMKFDVLELLFEFFSVQHLATNSERAQSFKAFCEEQGEGLRRFAAFDALFEHFRKKDINNWGWPCWPKTYQKPDSKAVKAFIKKNEKRIQYFEFLQWLSQEQFAVAQKTASEKGMMVGVYRDLAVGVDRGGADVWSDPELYCLDASAGAPPDKLGPQGQNWGLPPFNPMVLRGKGYKPFIRMIQNNMQDCGALRIDHAMGLFRLWWCPEGKGADAGAYVHYPLQDLLGIIKLESRRRNCLVFGEDLGVVPEEIKKALPPAKLYSSMNCIHEQRGDRYPMLDEFKVHSMANMTCHDTPPMKGWWQGKDIDLCEELGIFTPERAVKEREGRVDTRKAMMNTLTSINELPHDASPRDEDTPEYSRDLMQRITFYLSRSCAQIANIQLEDCMMIDTSVNVPGTSIEYPNWRRRLTENLETFFDDEGNKWLFDNINQCRKA